MGGENVADKFPNEYKDIVKFTSGKIISMTEDLIDNLVKILQNKKANGEQIELTDIEQTFQKLKEIYNDLPNHTSLITHLAKTDPEA
jgi:hypothetical protein